MAYNHDGKYDHFTAKMFTSKNVPDKNTNHGECSPPAPPFDWKKMKGWPEPWECANESDPHQPDGITEGDGSPRPEEYHESHEDREERTESKAERRRERREGEEY